MLCYVFLELKGLIQSYFGKVMSSVAIKVHMPSKHTGIGEFQALSQYLIPAKGLQFYNG